MENKQEKIKAVIITNAGEIQEIYVDRSDIQLDALVVETDDLMHEVAMRSPEEVGEDILINVAFSSGERGRPIKRNCFARGETVLPDKKFVHQVWKKFILKITK